MVAHGGYFYLFVSATDCCRGPLTGYSIFAGRASNILGQLQQTAGLTEDSGDHL